MLLRYRWKSRPDISELEQTIGQLRSVVIRLRRDLTHKAGYAAKLELVLKQRTKTIDDHGGMIEQLRAANQKLDAEAERYYQILAAG
jgi:hypothetical protein